MKTNKEWYPYEEYGSYFKLESGTLMQCPMNSDGTRDTSPCEVDWHEAWNGDVDLGQLIRELEVKE